MKYQVITPVYHSRTQFAVEDYVFVDTNNTEEAIDLAIPMLKDQYPEGYYDVVEPEDEREGLRVISVTAPSGPESIAQENTNVTEPAPVQRKQG